MLLSGMKSFLLGTISFEVGQVQKNRHGFAGLSMGHRIIQHCTRTKSESRMY